MGVHLNHPEHVILRQLASTPVAAYDGCRDTAWGVEWQRVVGGENYRCCTGGIVPDGVQYGSSWCSDGRLVRVRNHSCAFRIGAGTPQVSAPIYGNIWYCDRTNGHGETCDDDRGLTPIPGNAGVLVDVGRSLNSPGSRPSPSPTPSPVPSSLPTLSPVRPAPVAPPTPVPVLVPAPSRPTSSLPLSRTASMDPPVAGSYTATNMQELLDANPRNTTFLSYGGMDSTTLDATMYNLGNQAEIMARNGRDLAPQIALEINNTNLSEFIRDIQDPDSEVHARVQALGRQVKDWGKRVYIRPFSEMNDGSEGATWELGNRSRGTNTPAQLAKAWVLLHDVMDQEGATNALYTFAPLAARRVGRRAEMAETLNLIPRGYIDAFGLNVYTRPLSHYGENSERYVSFSELVQPWLAIQENSPHRGLPRMVPEMACSTQGSETERARWIKEAFQYGKEHGFKAMTYFNATAKWSLPEGGLGEQALKDSIAQF